MKLNKTTLMAALALGSMLTMGTALNAQNATPTNAPAATPPTGAPPMRHRPSPIDQLTKMLELTDDQKPKVQAALDDRQKKIMDMRGVAPQERGEKSKAMADDFNAKMKEVLTPEQFEKFQKMPQFRRPAPRPAAIPPAAAPATPPATPPATTPTTN